MTKFDEQLRQRLRQEDEDFQGAIRGVAGAVMGGRLARAYENGEVADSAINAILKHYHIRPKVDEIPDSVQTTDDRIEYRMRPFGIMRRTVKLERGWYRDAVGPMLGTLKEDGSAVALLPDKLSGYSYVDFSTGRRINITRFNADLFDEEALCFYQPLPLRSLKMRDLALFMAEQLSMSDVVFFLGMMALGTLLNLLAAEFTQTLFGSVLDSGSTQVLLALAAFMACFAASQALIAAFQALVNARLSTKQDVAVEAAVMGRILSLPPKFFKDHDAGELRQRAGYVNSLCRIMVGSIGTTALSSVFSLVYIGQIFTFAPAMVVPALVITLVTVAVSLATTFAQMNVSRRRMEISTQESALSYSMLTGIQKIKLSNSEKRMFSRWANLYAKGAMLDYNPPTFLKLSGVISLAVSLLGTLVLYNVALYSGVSVADYYAFNTAYGMVSGAFMGLAGVATTIATIRPTLEMAKPILEATPEVAQNKEVVAEITGDIEMSHVSFRYRDDMPYVIDDLSLKINRGEYLAIVGTTGCGKSTLLRLLLGFEEPQRGSIFYDRKDISRVDLRSLRRRIGVVMQDGKLFAGDIYSNIVIAAPQLTMEQAWKAAEIASIADDIREMPMGMHTMISEGQGGISGGQRQRLMIARAVAPSPRVLMFDEATSALDNVTQRKVSEAIDSLDCTRIVIAHRLSTIRHADRIIVMDKGKVVEDGSYEDLIAREGLFSELVARQRLDIPVEK